MWQEKVNEFARALVIDETDHFLVINKPADYVFQGTHDHSSLLTKLRSALNDPALFPSHRLDKITSGLLVLAKGEEANQALSMAFQQGEVEKYYLAISDRKPKKKQGLIVGDMERARRGVWRLLKSRQHPAITQFMSYSLAPGSRLFILRPRTGKTHQLRVAMKSLGAPLIGDPAYHAKVVNAVDCAGKECDKRKTGGRQQDTDVNMPDRAYLHAYALRFTLFGQHYSYVQMPQQGRWFLDPGFQSLLTSLPQPWDLPWPLLAGDSKNAKP